MRTSRDIEERIIAIFRRVVRESGAGDPGEISPGALVSDLCLDSIVLVEAIGEIEAELNLHVPRERLVGIRTIRDLVVLAAVLGAEAA